ncbi:MAG: hypothetical protein AB4426_13150 [Xenococcaceae cyanobacterium]
MAKNKTSNPAQVASGVEALIDRLRNEGVASGRTQADQIVSDARAQAESIVKEAQEQADQIVSQAREEAENLKRASNEALEVAFRDTRLALKTQLNQRFTGEVKRLVGAETEKQEILQKLISEVAGQVKEEVAEAKKVEVLLPRKVAGLEELSRDPEEMAQGILTHFVQLISRDMLREGISFGVAKDNQGGLKLRLVDEEVVLDLSDRAIADTILEHLQPRFRALLEGIVR